MNVPTGCQHYRILHYSIHYSTTLTLNRYPVLPLTSSPRQLITNFLSLCTCLFQTCHIYEIVPFSLSTGFKIHRHGLASILNVLEYDPMHMCSKIFF